MASPILMDDGIPLVARSTSNENLRSRLISKIASFEEMITTRRAEWVMIFETSIRPNAVKRFEVDSGERARGYIDVCLRSMAVTNRSWWLHSLLRVEGKKREMISETHHINRNNRMTHRNGTWTLDRAGKKPKAEFGITDGLRFRVNSFWGLSKMKEG